MEKGEPSGSGSEARITTKDTIAASELADMERIFHMIAVEDYRALETMLISGRAFHLPQGVEVYVMSENDPGNGICKLRIKGSILEFWASVSSIS